MQTHRNLYTGIHFTISILDLFLQKKYQFDFFLLSHTAQLVICREHLPNICFESYHPGRWNTFNHQSLLRFSVIVDTNNNNLSILKVYNLKGPFYLPVWLVRRAIQLSTIINGSIYICSCDTHLVSVPQECVPYIFSQSCFCYIFRSENSSSTSKFISKRITMFFPFYFSAKGTLSEDTIRIFLRQLGESQFKLQKKILLCYVKLKVKEVLY